MASRFSQIIDEIHARMNNDSITVGKGRLALKMNADFPRVVWILTGADHTYENNTGGRMQDGNTSRTNTVMTRTLDIECHVWGGPDEGDIEYTEQLVHAVLSAARFVLCGQYQLRGEDWTTQSTKGDYAVSGEKAIIRMGWQVPVMIDEPTEPEVREGNLVYIEHQADTSTLNGEIACDYVDP